MGDRSVPGWGVLMAGEGTASQGAGVPARDQVFTAEALGAAVELVGGTWAETGTCMSVQLPLPLMGTRHRAASRSLRTQVPEKAAPNAGPSINAHGLLGNLSALYLGL